MPQERDEINLEWSGSDGGKESTLIRGRECNAEPKRCLQRCSSGAASAAMELLLLTQRGQKNSLSSWVLHRFIYLSFSLIIFFTFYSFSCVRFQVSASVLDVLLNASREPNSIFQVSRPILFIQVPFLVRIEKKCISGCLTKWVFSKCFWGFGNFGVYYRNVFYRKSHMGFVHT